MANRAKIVFVIVEGIADQTALAVILSKLIKPELVVVEVFHGDITTDGYTTPQNIVSKLGNFVKGHGKPNSYKASDYMEVVHIVDTDGVFISDDDVVFNNERKQIFYKPDCIEARNRTGAINRNHQKAANLRRLISLPKVCGSIPYSIYFFSCNLDHVLHNNANMPRNDKDKFAAQFAFRYRNDLDGFLSFIQGNDLATKCSYQESWDYIRNGNNSLKRHTNLNLYFSQEAKNIKRSLI